MSRWVLVAALLSSALVLVPAKGRAGGPKDTPRPVYRCVMASGKVLYTTGPPRPGCMVLFTYTGTGKRTRIDYGERERHSPYPATGQAPTARSAIQVFRRSAPSIVVVVTYDASGKPAELGSGVKLPTGAVATNCHVLKDGPTHVVRYQGTDYPATLDKGDWSRDVCTLNVPGLAAPPAALGSTKTLQVGAQVFAIGAPEGLQLTLSEGIVSSMRPVDGGSYIQTTAAISPGSSGGGLFDDRGRLLGLTSFFASQGQQLNFALPVEWIEQLAHRETVPTATGAR